jgi:hypothetical protein
MQDTSRRLRIIVPLSVLTFLSTTSYIYAASAESRSGWSCASANTQSSGATSAHASSRAMSGKASDERTDNARRSHSASPHGMSSNVEAGQNGLSSTTSMPDGSTVTITSGQGSSKASAEQPGHDGKTAAGSITSNDDCHGSDPASSELESRHGNQPSPKQEKQK